MKKVPALLALLAFLVLAAATLYLSLRSSPLMVGVLWIPPAVASWADHNSDLRTAVPYALLAFLVPWIGGWIKLRYCAPFGFLALTLLLAATESSQFLLEKRSPSWLDIGWGMAGIAGGTAIGLLAHFLVTWVLRSSPRRSAKERKSIPSHVDCP